jgi:hypothetical protein
MNIMNSLLKTFAGRDNVRVKEPAWNDLIKREVSIR